MTDRQTDDRQTERQTDRQTEKSNPSMPYDTFACFAGLINVKQITSYDTRRDHRMTQT